MKLAKKLIVSLMTISLALTIFTIVSSSLASSPPTSMSAVLSGTTNNSQITIGSNPTPINTTFKIDVRIDNVPSIWSWTIPTVTWNSSVIQLIQVQEGPFLANNTKNGPVAFLGNTKSLWDNLGGSIMGGLTEAIQTDAVARASSGVISTLTFNITNFGTSPITIGDASVYANYSEAQNPTDNGLSVACNSATVTISSTSQSTPTPSPSTSPSPTPNSTPLQNATITVFKNKGGIPAAGSMATYGPRDLIKIYALVTYQNQVFSNQSVLFSIQNTNGSVIATQVAPTNQSGIAQIEYGLPSPDPNATQIVFGTWSITASLSIAQGTVSNSTTFSFNYLSNVENIQIPSSVHRSEAFPIELTINNGLFSAPTSELDITVFDQANTPIGSYRFTNTLQMQNFTVVDLTLSVPSTAFTGQATLYICLLNSNQTALAPETIVNFQILP